MAVSTFSAVISHPAVVVLSALLLTAFANPSLILASSAYGDLDFDGMDSDVLLFHQDYTPPAPPPPPPHPPSLSCEYDLGGVGSLDTTCQIVSYLNLSKNVYIEGEGNFVILPNVTLNCSSFSGCELTINVTGNFTLGQNSSIITGTFQLVAGNASFGNGSAVNTTGLAGLPPPQTSGTPQGLDGAGGGHGGRGAACLNDKRKLAEDVWGGDAYSWSTLEKPWSYGSRGGTTSREVDYGGGGGGRVMIVTKSLLEVNGSVLADGEDGGNKGGGGSGGSIYIKAYKMIGIGRISACGGNGFAGGGGGRVSVDIFSRHDEPVISMHGGSSLGCPDNAGAAGTFYDTVPRSLTVSNHYKSTYTDTLLMDFPQPFLTNVYIQNHAKAAVPLLWSRVQVQGQISLLAGAALSFGLAHYSMSEFELFAEELLMSDSIVRVFGALRMSVKMFLMWNSSLLIDGGGDENIETSLLEASNLVVLKESSLIHSNANLGVHGQGLLNLSGPGDCIEAQHLVLSLFYSVNIGPGSILRGPLKNASGDALMLKLDCESQVCPTELLHPPEDCNVNSSLSFTLQICRVEDILVEGIVEGSVVHFHRARTIKVPSSGIISTSGMGCIGGIGQGNVLSTGLGSGGGHGGKGGMGCYKDDCIEGGISYGNAKFPCELGSGSGNESSVVFTAGGGILVLGSLVHPLINLNVEGSIRADGESFHVMKGSIDNVNVGPGGGSGGTILAFLHFLALGDSGTLSSVGGHGSLGGGGGGGGGRIHFHWSDIATGDEFWPLAVVNGSINLRGGLGGNQGNTGENGTVSGKACPKGLYGIFCEECPVGTYKNSTGSDRSLCFSCPSDQLPNRGGYVHVRGGITETPCPYKCISERYHLPHCYTALEELIYTFGGPWLFCLLLLGLLILLALVLSVARMKFIGVEELSGPAPMQQGSQIDHSFPFLESLNEVLETNRVEESQSHVHRMYFMGPNTFSEPWHLPHTPPEKVKEIVYEGAFNTFVDEMNSLAAYQWWEGSLHSILYFLAYPLAWSWQQWRRRIKLQRIREFVRSEYDHACLRSCRSRALYEGLKVAATPDLMLAYVDFFLGGDEKRSDLPPSLRQRLPMSLLFGGNGSYMTPFSLHNDGIITSLTSQSVPPTTWYRFVAGLNAQLRLVCRGCLRSKFRPVIRWLEDYANPTLRTYGVCVDLAWFGATTGNFCHYGLLIYAVEEETDLVSLRWPDGSRGDQEHSRDGSDYEFPVDAQCQLMDKVGLAEGALHELSHEFQLYVLEEVRNKISTLETNLVKENEKFVSQIAEIDKHRRTQQERERKFDLQYQRSIAEALDNHLTAVQRDHEHISQLEEKRIRDDAAREEAKRKEKTLIEEKLHKEKIKAEEEASLQAERAEMAKAAAEAEKQSVGGKRQDEKQDAELAATKNAVETLRNGVPKIEALGQVVPTGFDDKRQVSSSGRNMTRASKNALELEKKRLHIYEKLTMENEAIKASSDQGNRRTGQNFNRLIKTISATVENVRTKADELVNLISSPEYPRSISILSFAEKVVFNCENSQKSDGFIFSCSRVIVLVTSKIPLALDILMAELNRVCMYTVPKYVEYSPVLFPTREAYFKAIGYKEIDGKIENTDSYVERLSSIMRLYGALVQTEIGGFQNLHGLEEGWAWLARFLNSLPANLYTAVALQHFLEMSGYALYQRYRNQFEKLLRIIAHDFLKALKEGNSDSVNAKLIKVKTSIINYIESSQFKKEPEGLQLRGHLDSNEFF